MYHARCAVIALPGVEAADVSAHVGVHGQPETDGVRQNVTGRHRAGVERRLRVPDGVDNDRLQRPTQL